MTPVTIAYVINTLEVGGAEGLLVDIVRRLDRNRFRPMVFGAFGGGVLAGPLRDAGVRVACLRKHVRFGVDLIARLAWEFRRQRIHIVHTHLPGAGVYGSLAAMMARVPLILHTCHSTVQWTDSVASRWVWRRVQPRLAQVIAVSRYIADDLQRAARVDGSRVQVIYNGIDTRRFAAAHTPFDAVRRGVIIGRLDMPKGHIVALQALSILRRRGIPLALSIVGRGPLEQPLREAVEELRLPDVLFCGEQADVVPLLREAEVAIIPSVMEGVPLALLEAMGAGKLVVASSVGGIPEVVADGRDGILVPPGDPHALAEALAQAINAPHEAGRLARAAQNKIRDAFDIARTVAAYEALYDQLWQRVEGRRYA